MSSDYNISLCTEKGVDDAGDDDGLEFLGGSLELNCVI